MQQKLRNAINVLSFPHMWHLRIPVFRGQCVRQSTWQTRLISLFLLRIQSAVLCDAFTLRWWTGGESILCHTWRRPEGATPAHLTLNQKSTWRYQCNRKKKKLMMKTHKLIQWSLIQGPHLPAPHKTVANFSPRKRRREWWEKRRTCTCCGWQGRPSSHWMAFQTLHSPTRANVWDEKRS